MRIERWLSGASVCHVTRTQVTVLMRYIKAGIQIGFVTIVLGGQRWVDLGVSLPSSLLEMASARFSERHYLKK